MQLQPLACSADVSRFELFFCVHCNTEHSGIFAPPHSVVIMLPLVKRKVATPILQKRDNSLLNSIHMRKISTKCMNYPSIYLLYMSCLARVIFFGVV